MLKDQLGTFPGDADSSTGVSLGNLAAGFIGYIGRVSMLSEAGKGSLRLLCFCAIGSGKSEAG